MPYSRICPWFDYLLDAKSLAAYISKYRDLTTGAIFTLKENANILTINSSSQIKSLADKYPSYHHILNYYQETQDKITIFDFEELSKLYDGIYVDYETIYNNRETTIFDSWSINTLLLFNLNCIKEYQSVKINVDFEDYDTIPYIDSNNISKSKKIGANSITYKELYNYIETIFKEFISTSIVIDYNNYDKYLESLTNIANKVIQITEKTKNKELRIIQETLKSEGLEIKIEVILRNIVLNYLSNYLYQEKEQIKTLPKTLIKERKNYQI